MELRGEVSAPQTNLSPFEHCVSIILYTCYSNFVQICINTFLLSGFIEKPQHRIIKPHNVDGNYADHSLSLSRVYSL